MLENVRDTPIETLDLLPYGIIVLDNEGVVLYYNPREEAISGRKKENVVGRNFFTEVAPCTAVNEFYGRFLELIRTPGASVDFDFAFNFPGNEREVRISLTSFDDREQRMCIVAVADETERRRIQRQLSRQERLRAVGETAAGIAHNFNNLLTSILGNTELLLATIEDPKARKRLETITRAATDGARLVERIRDFTREKASDDFHATDLNHLVRDAVALAEHYAKGRGKAIRIEVDLAEDIAPIRAIDTEIREVLVNLIHNAVDAYESDGVVTVKTKSIGDRARVFVRDAGRGIPREIREKVFLPFFTTKGEAGTGLGLAVCARIAQHHDGDLDVDSEVGQGTTFKLTIPLASEG